MEYFGKPNGRITRMREDIMDTQPTVCAERAVLTTQAYQANKEKRPVLKRALALDHVLRNMTIYICLLYTSRCV